MTEQQKQPTTATSAKVEEAKPKAKPVGKTFRVLRPGEFINRCSYILPNSLQCWKAGEEEITDVKEDGTEQVYQFCERHVRIQRAVDAGLLKPEHIDTPMKEMTVEIPAMPLAQAEGAKIGEPLLQGEPKKA